MINRTRCLFYEVKGVFFKDLAEAQSADLLFILPVQWPDGTVIADRERLAEWMIQNAAEVARILTTTPRSRNRKPRKDKGVPRKVKVEATT